MIDPYWYAFLCVLTGGILGVIIPYMLKAMDNEVTFSYSYSYALVISMLIAAAGLVPETTQIPTGRTIMMLIMSGFGIQQGANLLTTQIRKRTTTKG